jgi:outer membrane protein OmpA-like peptidoglycan-associated protein
MKRKMMLGWFLLGLVFESFGQQSAGLTGIDLSASGVKLVGGATDDCAIGYMSGINLSHSFSKYLTGAFSMSMGWVRPRDPNSYFKNSTTALFRTYLYPWNFSLRVNLLPDKRINPYIGFGAGLLHWNLRDVSSEDNWLPYPESGISKSGAQKDVDCLGMLGAEWFLSDRVALNGAIRFHALMDQDLDNIGTGDANNAMAEVRLGLTLLLGGNRDKDGDGIPDAQDACPDAAEDIDGFQDGDGCPDLDNDADGVPDSLDACPNVAEDKDGFKDSDGCPDLDNDGDGIPDAKDLCPNLAEDRDGFQDEDGCPDLDNDKDGIPDLKDKCPNEPETVNGYQDDDGCPDQPEAAVPTFEKGRKLVLQGVQFEPARAVLTREGETVLDRVAASLTANAGVSVEIRGFTDSVGSDVANLSLSQKRANTVKAYLVQKGIAAKRLKPVGYGEADPIASNKTAEGRAMNRRIEFIPIETE